MLTQSRKKRCIWAAIAIFSAIAVLGNGLHSLPGLGHSSCGHVDLFSTDGCGDSATDRHCHPSSHTDTAEWESLRSLHSNDDCPICHFLAQAKTLAPATILEVSYDVAFYNVIDYQSNFIEPIQAAYQSRGPPSWQLLA